MKSLGLIILLCGLTGLVVFGAMGGFDFGPADNRGTAKGPLTTEQDFRNKLAEIRINKDKLERGIDKLEESKQKNLDFLKAEGITKVADAQGKPAAEIALHNLKAWSESIQELTNQLVSYDSAISRLEGMLDQLERERINESAGLTEEQAVELRAIVMDLDDRLNIGENDALKDSEMDALLEKELNPSNPP